MYFVSMLGVDNIPEVYLDPKNIVTYFMWKVSSCRFVETDFADSATFWK